MTRLLHILKRTDRWAIAPYLLCAGLALPFVSESAVMAVNNPIKTSIGYSLNHSFENNDSGAIYNSATHSVAEKLAQNIFDLGIHGYGSVDALANGEFPPTIGTADGDSFTGWTAAAQNDGEIKLSPTGPFGNTIWDTEKMAVNTGIAYTLLELNGIPDHQEITLLSVRNGSFTNKDATVVRSDDPLLDYFIIPLTEAEKTATFTGVFNIYNEFTTTGNNYLLVTPDDLAPHPESTLITTNGFQLIWNCASGATYQAEYSTNLLTSWLDLGTPITATAAVHQLELTITNHPAFFRVWFE